MRFTRAVAVLVVLFYVFLWVLALNGVSSLTPILVVPPVLAALVAFGVWLNNFMGITPRRPRFVDPEDDASPRGATAVEVHAETPENLEPRPSAPPDPPRRAAASEDPPG